MASKKRSNNSDAGSDHCSDASQTTATRTDRKKIKVALPFLTEDGCNCCAETGQNSQ